MRRGGTYLLIGLNKSIKRMTSSVYSSRLIGGGIYPPPEKNIISLQTAAKLCALDLFFDRDSELQIYHGNFLLMHNRHRKLFVIKQPKGSKFMPKIHQNTFGSRALPGPVGGGLMQMHSRRPSSRNGGLFLRAGRDREWVYI